MMRKTGKASSIGPRIAITLFGLVSIGLFPLEGHGRQAPAQPPSRPEGATGGQPGRNSNSTALMVSPDEDYRIGNGDVIEVQIEDAPELSKVFRVTAAGTFMMGYLGRISAAQKTPEEVAQLIANGLRGKYLKEPKVTVTVKEYNSRSFFIQGAVRQPGVYQIEGRPRLLQLISVASGLADNHGSSAFIIRQIKRDGDKHDVDKAAEAAASGDSANRRRPASGKEEPGAGDDDARYELLKVNINGLLRGHFDQDARLEPGDVVNIPVTDVFFVAGEVRAPGSFQLKEGTTLRQAISMAQGTTFKAASGRGVIFREDPETGKRNEIKVDIGAVMGGKKEDMPVIANDVIIVPNSRFKSVGSVLLSGFGVSAARLPIP